MTFDKYKGKYVRQIIFPKDGYEYDYVWTKRIGWHVKRGKKLSELPKQKWDIKIPKEI